MTDIHIGTGQDFPTLGAATAVMQDGDTLLIHPGTYPEIPVIDRSGVLVKGVLGPNGERPVILGTKATIPAHSAVGYKPLETFGGVRVGPTIRSGNVIPHDITFENLEVRGANSDQADKSITLSDGTAAAWDDFACGIYLLTFDRVTIRNCKVTDNGNGIFTHDGHHCADLLIENCEVFGNGKIGSYSDHNLYVQCIRPIYRGNFFGGIRPGSAGGNLKDRSADPLIEGNLILAGARQIDLSEWSGEIKPEIEQTDNSSRVTIRKNTLVNQIGDAFSLVYMSSRTSSSGVPFQVEFSNNTVVVIKNQGDYGGYYTNLFACEYQPEAQISAAKNLFHVVPKTAGQAATELRLLSNGTLRLNDNWANTGAPLSEYSPTPHTITGMDTFKRGDDPGFVDFANGDYRLKDDAPAKGYGANGTPPAPVDPPPPPVDPPPPPPPSGDVEVPWKLFLRTKPDGTLELVLPLP